MSSYIIKSELKLPKTGYHSVISFIIDRLKAWHEDIILLDCDLDHQWTGEEVYESCLNFAYHLITEYLLKPGDIVCFITPNSDIHAIALLGVIAAGGVYCSLSPLSSYREVNEVVNNIRPSFLVCHSDNYGIAASLTVDLPYIKKLFIIDEPSRKQLNLECDTIENMIHYERSFLPLPISTSLDDKTVLIISSGSTGTPKAVIRTNRNLIAIANALQHQELDEYSRGNIVMANCFCHICGLRTVLQSISSGSTLALTRNNEWRENFFKNIEKYRITSAFLMPSELYYMVKNDVIADKYDLSSLQDIMVGGSALTDTIHKAIINKFKFKNFRNAYRMTEVGWAAMVYLSESKSLNNYKTVGRPVAGTEIKVIDSEGKSLPFNSIGEICVRGDQVSPGYLNNYKENQNTFTSDGFLRTGDTGYYGKEGLFYIVGRYKEMIKVEGEIVSPAELESILLTHVAVEDAVVVGIENEERGEVPKAFVTLKKGKQVDEKSLVTFVNLNVNPIKKLRGGVKFLEEFPRSALGVIKKNELKKIS